MVAGQALSLRHARFQDLDGLGFRILSILKYHASQGLRYVRTCWFFNIHCIWKCRNMGGGGVLFWGPCSKDSSILGYMLGVSYLW